jgi:hypothetical protein
MVPGGTLAQPVSRLLMVSAINVALNVKASSGRH